MIKCKASSDLTAAKHQYSGTPTHWSQKYTTQQVTECQQTIYCSHCPISQYNCMSDISKTTVQMVTRKTTITASHVTKNSRYCFHYIGGLL